jgi:hypothetical protein
MAATTITTKFSIGDIAYIVIHPTADILQCEVLYVRITPEMASTPITYKVTRTDVPQIIDYIFESEIYTFADAKTELLGWLSDQTAKVTAMTEPPIPGA